MLGECYSNNDKLGYIRAKSFVFQAEEHLRRAKRLYRRRRESWLERKRRVLDERI